MPSFPNRSVIPIHRLPQIYLDSFENSQWSDPRDWVEYGKYTMRRMDRDRIEAGYVVRVLVKWWGGTTARPYLWKRRRHRIRPTGRTGTIPANHALPKSNDSRTGHAVSSPRRRNRAARAGNGRAACYNSLPKDPPFPPVRKDPTWRQRLQGCTERPTGTALHPTLPSSRLVAIG